MRNEKTLLNWPVPECPDIPQQEPKEQSQYKKTYFHRFAAQIAEVNGEAILGFTVFNMGGAAVQRFWQSAKQNGMQVFQSQPHGYNGELRVPGKMYSSCIDSEFSMDTWQWCNSDQFYSTAEQVQTVRDFLKKDGTDPGNLLADFQRENRKKQLEERDDKKRAYIRGRFSKLGEIPEALKDWCIETVMKEDRYFFYEYTGRKLQRGKCSHCGTWSEIPGIREYGEGTCPVCGTKLEYRSLKRPGRTDNRYEVGFLDDLGDELCMRTFNAYITFKKNEAGIPGRKISIYEEERAFMDRQLQCKENFSKGGSYSVTVDGFHSNAAYSPLHSRIFPANLAKLRTQLGLRTELEVLAERGELVGCINHIFDIAARRPETEYLIKSRFYKIASDVLRLYPGEETGLHQEGRNAAQVLGIPADELMKLRNVNPGLEELETISSLYLNKSCLRQDEMEDICYLGISSRYAWELGMLADRCSLRKALNYIKKHGGKNGGNKVLIEWRDYMKICELVGYNTNDPQVFLPKNIASAHEQMQKLYESRKNELIEKGIERQSKKLGSLCWASKNLFIRPAKSQQELVDEGQYLRHCVGKAGYDKKMAEGKTAIFFIRHKAKPDTPYVTLELNLKDYRVAQCYAALDKYPGDAVKAFYQKWESEIIPAVLNKYKEVRSA